MFSLSAFQKQLSYNKKQIKSLLKQKVYTWNNLAQPIEELQDRLNQVWAPIHHIKSVCDSPKLRKPYEKGLLELTAYQTELGQNKKLFQAYQAISLNKLKLDQKKVIENALRDFKLAGVGLPAKYKKQYARIQKQLAQLSNRFSQNVLDATQRWYHLVTRPKELAGLPDSFTGSAAQAAKKKKLKGWLLTLDFPSYHAVMTYAENRSLRNLVYAAYSTRAPKNSPIMADTLKLRHQTAKLLGFNNYAELSLATNKMVKSTDAVMSFLQDLAHKTRKEATQELKELSTFAQKKRLQPWDLLFYSEQLRQQRFNISQEALRPYFPIDHVLNGLFGFCLRLFGITAKERFDFETWHKEVRCFDLYDDQRTLRGQCYLDLYARDNKQSGAWMGHRQDRKHWVDESLQTPIAYIICNFKPAAKSEPALLTHDDVVTLFHEFGHGLHQMLTVVDIPSIAGTNGVAWDAVELPSQFFENWCWEKETLRLLTKHYQTGQPLPNKTIDQLYKLKLFQTGLHLVRQLEFALFDFKIHLEYNPKKHKNTEQFIQKTLNTVRRQVSVIKPPSYNRFQHSFSHIFAGGYSAGYYSYLWAEVLAADAFATFEEKGLFNETMGRAFLHSILEQGGVKGMQALFKEFRGRPPENEAFLRQKGLITSHSPS